MELFFSVGEPSGDLHGANLIRALRQRSRTVRCVGFGGPRMREAGCELHEDLTQYAVMWVSQVLVHLRHFFRLLKTADNYFANHRPDAVVLIDYPGFNWWIARKAKKRGIPVVYYGTPQLWAWAPWRVRKMRRLVDHALCKLPFEEAWFRQRGVNATHVGHPYFDELEARELDATFINVLKRTGRPVVTILPGSRTQEVKSNLPSFLRAAECVAREVPNVLFYLAAFNQAQAEHARQLLASSKLEIEVHVGRTPELIEAAEICIACSGSVSLELLYHEKPSVVLYSVTRLAYLAQGILRTSKYITLTNLLADHHQLNPPVPEYLTWRDVSAELGAHVTAWLTDLPSWQQNCAQLRVLREKDARGGASQRAAEYILRHCAAHSGPRDGHPRSTSHAVAGEYRQVPA